MLLKVAAGLLQAAGHFSQTSDSKSLSQQAGEFIIHKRTLERFKCNCGRSSGSDSGCVGDQPQRVTSSDGFRIK
jgi:hypothetical protein